MSDDRNVIDFERRAAQVRNTSDPNGQWTVIFDYDRLVFEDERIEAKAIVKTACLLQAIVRHRNWRWDDGAVC